MDDTRRGRASSAEHNLLLTHSGASSEEMAPKMARSVHSAVQKSSVVEEIQAAAVRSGNTPVITAFVSTSDSGFKHNSDQTQKSERRTVTEQHSENREENKSEFKTSTDHQQEQVGESLATAPQSSHASNTVVTPSATITAWEAGWNVTNAIQVC